MGECPASPEEFVRYFDSARRRTLTLLPLVPDGDLEWRPEEHAFSFGDVFRHLAAMERWMWAETVAGRATRYSGHDERFARGREAVGRYVEDLHARSVRIFTALSSDTFLARITTPGGTSLPVWKWLRAMAEHEAHHRGQLYLMLRIRGVRTPPLFGLTSEDVTAAARVDGD